VQHLGENEIVLEVGGIGLRLWVPSSVLQAAPAVGQPYFLHTHFMVREDAQNLYGFSSLEERELFELLLQVSGVGPKSALGLLSHLQPDQLRAAVVSNQPETLAIAPGIGRKTAEKIIFHLKDRMRAPLGVVEPFRESDSDVLSVLTTLGYGIIEAQKAVQSFPLDAPEDLESRVKLALQFLASR
jgi:Holliday junction DNA helicase RuvA